MDGVPLIDVPVPRDERIATLVEAFRAQYGREPEGIAEAPGRVNLIGEHVDYNDGLVLPFAIDRSVMCAWADNPTGATYVYSFDQNEKVYADERVLEAAGTWSEYWLGILDQLIDEGLMPHLLALAGNVPQGAGLSSSAALELSIAGAIRESSSLTLTDDELALLCQRAENEYVGVQCGIMDQFASALSKAGHALLIDCRTLAYEHVPLRLAEHGLAIVIANSAVRRELVTSAYNERRRECEAAVGVLRERLGRPDLSSLRDVTPDEIAGLAIAAHDVVLRRARHVVTEIARVVEAVEALERDDFARLGELMAASHVSLRDDYEVSSEQLDLLVGLASAQEYVLGSRLTGAGFGGCTVSLVRSDRVEGFARDVIAPYRERTGLPAVTYVTEPCDGLRTWKL